MSFRRRIVVLVAAAVAAAVLGASALVYVVMRGELNAQLDNRLRAQAPKALIVSIERSGEPPGPEVSRTVFGQRVTSRVAPGVRARDVQTPVADFLRVGVPPPPDATIAVPGPLGGSAAVAQLLTQQGEVVGGISRRARLPVTAHTQAVAAGESNAFFSNATVGGVAVRMLTVPGPGGAALTVAEPRGEVDGALHRLLLILLLVSGAGIAAAAGLGVLVSRRALAPVERLTAATEHVAATQDLSRRIEVGGDDELARMARSFNTMLAALDGARAAQRQLVADASHELRTPLTAVRTSVEALARAPADGVPAAERRQALATAQAQLEDLSVLVGDLVDLARPAEPRAAAEEAEDVRLDLLVEEAVARARRHAPRATFRVDADESFVRGTPARLHRAVGNLLDNAVKHGGADGEIEVEVRVGPSGGPAVVAGGEPHGAEVRVRDHGPGIALDDLPHVFDRFYRARRARGLPGAGLGLAIVRQVAEAHGGSVRAELPADGSGARLVLSLPS
ncbi:MAG TPA: HAMP domain-containing sensor histidine kinase [Conexibacter sp.]|nr:HAMP domain-containing sensor histidine kinase [Conexibacter sp.]